MNLSETARVNAQQLNELKKLVAQGEGLHLEFKRKAAHPEKLVREMIAFANTNGGSLLIGVGDDKSIPGIKYPEEEILVVKQAIEKFCRPQLVYQERMIPITDNQFVVELIIPQGERRPYFFKYSAEEKESFVRESDKSIKASKEMVEIVRRAKTKKDIRFTFGEAEKKLMEYLEVNDKITLPEFRKVAMLNRFLAAKKLILLVLANVLRITPTEKGDYYSRGS
jgi:predicted HTH transcriptional regulator